MGWCLHLLVQVDQISFSLGAAASPASLNALGQGIVVYLEQGGTRYHQVSSAIHQAGTPSSTGMLSPMLSFGKENYTKSTRIALQSP